jgi:hypothetical protein
MMNNTSEKALKIVKKQVADEESLAGPVPGEVSKNMSRGQLVRVGIELQARQYILQTFFPRIHDSHFLQAVCAGLPQ